MVNKHDPIPDGSDNFEQNIISTFHGYVSSVDPTKVKANVLVRGSVNVYKKISGNIANRPGKKQYDPLDDTIAGVDSAYVWNTSLGVTFPLRVSNSKFQFYSTISGTGAWYDLQTSLTLSRYVFETVWDNTLKKDFLVFVRGDSNLFKWDGGVAKFVSGINNTSITLDRASATAGFPTSGGTVKINGNSYTYTGVSGNTLTGVTGNSSAEPVDSIVILQVVTNVNTPASGFNNDFIKVNKNQLGVGSYTSRIFYISKNTSVTDYSQSTPRIPGDGELLTLDNTLKGVTVKDGNFWISAGSSDWYEQSFNQITVGTTLTEQTKVDKKPTPVLGAAYAHEFIEVINNTIHYLSQDQQLRTIGLYRNLNQPAYPTLSQEIFTELQEEDFTLGQLKAIGDFIYLIAPNSGRVYLHQTRSSVSIEGNVVSERLWHAPFVWGISRIFDINGDVVGFSNANPQMYYLWDTNQWHDDSPSGESLPYTSVMLLAYQNGNRRQGLINFDKIYYEGYIAGNLYESVYYDYQGSTNFLSSTINSTESFATLYTGIIPPSLGDASLGDNPLGSGVSWSDSEQAMLPKFRAIICKDITNCFEFAPMVYSNEVDSRWEIVALGANISLADVGPVEIIKQD